MAGAHQSLIAHALPEPAPDGGGFVVVLDGSALCTPGRLRLKLPTRALAQAIAGEWAAQTTRIDPLSMPLTRLANVAIERTPQTRAALAAEVQRYGETDLLHHRADSPEGLVRHQADAWDPILDWGEGALGLRLEIVQGVIAPARDASALAQAALALDDFRLTGLVHGANLLGSAFLAFALLRQRIAAMEALRLSRVDEDFQEARWGQDAQSQAAKRAQEADLLALGRFFALLDAADTAL